MIRTKEAGPPIAEVDIAAFERKYALALPPAYRRFLLESNGGRPERDLCPVPNFPPEPVARIEFFFGIGHPIKTCDLAWNRGVYSPPDFVVIAYTASGDTFCVGLSEEYYDQVFFWDYYGDLEHRLHRVANSFEEFLNGLTRDEHSPKMEEPS